MSSTDRHSPMQEENLSRLSALLDGECSDAELDELLAEMDRSPELSERWSQLCRDQALRQGRTPIQAQCICADVMARLDEPARSDQKVRPLRAPPPRLRLPRWAVPAGGLAAAASLGAAAVLVIQPESRQQPMPVPAGLAAIGEPVDWARESGQTVAQVEAVTVAERPEIVEAQPPQGQLLDEYLIDHSYAVAGEGMSGTMRYARFAAHEAEYRPMTLEYR